MKVDGANVFVTGASSGIGAALARMLAERGATVGVVARREDRLREVLDDCQKHTPGSRMWVLDVGDIERAEQVMREAWDAFDHLDVIVHNAAIPMRKRVQRITYDEVDHTMRVNFLGPIRMTLAVLPRMLERNDGVIVNVSSTGGRLGIIHEAAYCASKFALCGWSESMAIDLARTNVKVRLVNPGPIDTEIWDLPGNEPALYDGPKHPPEEVAEGIIAAIEGDGFEHYLPDMQAIVDWKTSNIDEFLATVSQMERD